MYCQLQSIVEELESQFPVRTYGILSGPIRAIRCLQSNRINTLEKQVLYVATQGDLAMIAQETDLCCYPILCVDSHISDKLSRTFLSMRSLVWVKHDNPTDVLVALSEILYRLGNQHTIPEAYWALMPAENLDELMVRAGELFDCPFFLTDWTMKILATSENRAAKLMLAKLRELDLIPNLSGVFTEDALAESVVRYGLEMYDYKIEDNFYIRKIPLKQNNTVKGYLLMSEHDPNYPDSVLRGCAIVSHFAMNFLRSNTVVMPQHSSRERFLEMILNCQISDETEIAVWLERYHWIPKKQLYVLVLSHVGASLAVSPHDVLHELTDYAADLTGLVYQSSIVLLYESAEELSPSLLQQQLSPILGEVQKYDLHCGISRAVSCLKDIPKAYFTARKVLDLGRVFDPALRMHFYEDCSVYLLLHAASQTMDLEQLVLPRVYQLEQNESSEFLQTLEVYMKNGCSITQCAKQLYFHVNTVKYRLNQIQEILQCDIKDGDVFCQVYLSLKIRKFMEVYQKFEP